MEEKYNFETVIKRIHNSNVDPEVILINKRSITFGKSFSKILNTKYVEILQDKKKNLIAFRPTETKEIGFVLYKALNYQRTGIPSRWMVPKESYGSYIGKIKDNMIIIDFKFPIKKY